MNNLKENYTSETSSNLSSDTNSDTSYKSYNTNDSEKSINETNIDLTNDIINEYNVISKLGSGAFSMVWLVYSISDSQYYALKVQNYDDYIDGIDEIKIHKRLPNDCKFLNKMIKYFIEERIITKKVRKFICSVYELCCNNLDTLIRKGNYNKGFEEHTKHIFLQICKGINILHNNLKVFHGDLKPDNILLKGTSIRDSKYIEYYTNMNFNKKYKKLKEEQWVNAGKNIKKIKTMPIEDKLNIRKKIHQEIINNLPDIKNEQYFISNKYFDVTIADFGHYCPDDEMHDDKFGTQMYQAPEIILLGDCTNKVDIWALGCSLYEFLTGELLFDPWGDDDITTDLIHLNEIQNLFGKFDEKYVKKSKCYNTYFKENKLKKYQNDLHINNTTDFYTKLKQKLSNTIFSKDFENIYDLLTKMLHPISYKRISINNILDHKWFT